MIMFKPYRRNESWRRAAASDPKSLRDISSHVRTSYLALAPSLPRTNDHGTLAPGLAYGYLAVLHFELPRNENTSGQTIALSAIHSTTDDLAMPEYGKPAQILRKLAE